MELKYLVTVKKIIETGNYQSAARALNYAQSTITFQMKQLEKELGFQLFEKNGNRMELTQAGINVLPIIERILDATEELTSYGTDVDEVRGTLKVALPESLITYKIQPILRYFRQKAPNVKLSLQVMNCYEIQAQLMKGNIDLAIQYEVGKYPNSIVAQEIDSYPLILVGSPVLDDLQRNFISPDQRKGLCHISNDPNALYLKIFNHYIKDKNIVLDTELELWSIESIKQSVMSNLGIAYLPLFAVEREISTGKLIKLDADINYKEIKAIYAYNRNRWMSPAMDLFIQLIDSTDLESASA